MYNAFAAMCSGKEFNKEEISNKDVYFLACSSGLIKVSSFEDISLGVHPSFLEPDNIRSILEVDIESAEKKDGHYKITTFPASLILATYLKNEELISEILKRHPKIKFSNIDAFEPYFSRLTSKKIWNLDNINLFQYSVNYILIFSIFSEIWTRLYNIESEIKSLSYKSFMVKHFSFILNVNAVEMAFEGINKFIEKYNIKSSFLFDILKRGHDDYIRMCKLLPKIYKAYPSLKSGYQFRKFKTPTSYDSTDPLEVDLYDIAPLSGYLISNDISSMDNDIVRRSRDHGSILSTIFSENVEIGINIVLKTMYNIAASKKDSAKKTTAIQYYYKTCVKILNEIGYDEFYLSEKIIEYGKPEIIPYIL